MGKSQFFINTGGHCFLCLKILTEDGHCHPNGGTFSFQTICRYLKTNWRDVFGEMIPTFSIGTSLEETEIKGPLCAKCSHQLQTFSQLFLELEVVQMKLQSCLKSIRDVMENPSSFSDRDDDDNEGQEGPLEKFKRKMLRSSETLAQYGNLERLRRNILEQSSKLIDEEVSPRVILKRGSRDDLRQTKKMRLEEVEPKPDVDDDDQIGSSPSSPQVEMTITKTMSISEMPTPNGGYANVADDLAHEDNEDPLMVLLECDICHAQVSDLSAHLYAAHFGADAVTDEAPMKVEIGSEMLEENVAEDPLDEKPKPKCHICKKEFGSKPALTRHQQEVHFGRTFQCDLCFDWFSKKIGLSRHQRQACPLRSGGTNTASSAIKPIECDICHALFISHQARSRHQEEEHDGYKFGCDHDHCDEKFKFHSGKHFHMNKAKFHNHPNQVSQEDPSSIM